MTRQGFRRLIILQWLLIITYYIVYFATLGYLPPQLQNYLYELRNAEPTSRDWIFFTMGLFVFSGYVVAGAGLFLFKAWAKKLLLAVNVAALVTTPFFGVCIQSEWAGAVGYLISLIEGGILFLIFFSPVSRMFEADGYA